MKINKNLSDSDIIREIGDRIKYCRIKKECTQAEFAELCGVSRGTVSNAENGESIQFNNMLRILRELDALNALDILLPSSERTPMELIATGKDSERKRFRKSSKECAETAFKWGDEK